jgi:ubiquinone biosynthesis protein
MGRMADWTEFLAELDIGSLVPAEYERYQPAVVDGLAFFLGNLPPDRVFAILAEQADLPDDAGLEDRLVAVVRNSPVLHKLGQVLARDRRLPARLRQALQTLESMMPAQSPDEVRQAVERETGPLDRLGIDIDGLPLAEASVAVVIPFLWADPPEGLPQRGVFKVLKPGIEERLDQDLELLTQAGGWLDERCREYGLPDIEYQATFGQVRDLLRREVHLDREQEHLSAAAADFAGQASRVVIPRLYPVSTPRLTAMERIDGRKVTEVDTLPSPARRALAGLVADALIAHPILSAAPSALFHADPHAGNLMVTEDGRLAILDWSLVGYLGEHDRVCLSQMLLGAVTLDEHRILAALDALAAGPFDATALRRAIREALRRLTRGVLPGLGWLTDLLDAAVTTAGVSFHADLILFRKVLHTVAGVTADVSEAVGLDGAVAARFLTQFGLETAPRLWASPWSRAFGTHVSNADLVRLVYSVPFTPLRYWSLMAP